MKLQTIEYPFTLLTPCFSGTALGKRADHAEMRVPPIRGHVRFWHRALFDAPDCNRVWGSASGNAGQGSRVALRFYGETSPCQGSSSAKILPHKSNFERPAIASGAQLTLRLQRLVGCTNDDWEHARRAVKLWLLVGALGLRANRAAGSVWPAGGWAPVDDDALRRLLRNDPSKGGLDFTWAVQLSDNAHGCKAEELRAIASNTLGGSPSFFGGIKPSRRPSPLKFKVIRLGGQFRLLALAKDPGTISGAWRELTAKPLQTKLTWTSL